MINDHAILLTRETIPDVIYATHAQRDLLEELVEESETEKFTYIVHFSRTTSGLPGWTVYKESEFWELFRVHRMKTEFVRVDVK